MKQPNDTDVNKLKDQVKQLQDELSYLQMQKDILEKAGEIIKKDQGIFLEALTTKKKQPWLMPFVQSTNFLNY